MNQPSIDNTTEFVVHPQPLLDKEGDKLVVIVKGTFELAADGVVDIAPKERRRGIRMADIPWGKPEVSSILYPTDLCLRKPGTDIVVVAKGYAPSGKAVPTFDVAVQVGYLRKVVRVFGLRVWQSGGSGLSPPRPLQEIEMRYDFAWGGTDASDPNNIVEEPRNPVGLGVARDLDTLTHQPAPNLEDPLDPIMTASTYPKPAGIGAIGRHFLPRRDYVGTYDKRWLEERAPLLPLDQDDRMNLCASPDLVAIPPLVGGEEVALLNLVKGGGTTTFRLPKVMVSIAFHVKDRPPESIRPYLDTVVIDTLDREPSEPVVIELVWRASVVAPRKMKDAKVVVREVSEG